MNVSAVVAVVACMLAVVGIGNVAYGHDGHDGLTTVAGRVSNGTTGFDTPEDVQATLWIFSTDDDPEATSVGLDAGSTFLFQEVQADGVSGYVVAVTYQEVSYAVPLVPEDDLTNVDITIYEATESLDIVSLVGNTIIVLGADSASRTVSVMEIAQVSNSSDRTFVSNLEAGGPMNLLRFPLPANATNLDVQAELPEGQSLQVDKGFALSNPVPPGEYGVVFTYVVPYDGNELDLSRTLLRGAGTIRLLVPTDIATIHSSALINRGETVIGNTAHQMYEAREMAPDSEIDMVLRGLPQPSLLQGIGGLLETRGWLAAPLVLAAVLMGLLVAGLAGTRYREAAAPDETPQERLELVQTIAELDDQFDDDEIEEARYASRREVLKRQLLRLAWEEEPRP